MEKSLIQSAQTHLVLITGLIYKQKYSVRGRIVTVSFSTPLLGKMSLLNVTGLPI